MLILQNNNINEISKFRGKNREDKINEVCEEILKTLHRTKQQNLNTSELRALFNAYNTTTKRIIRNILNTLIKSGKIKEEIQYKTCYTFINAEIGSNDYNSFEMLMEKNGYRKDKEIIKDNEYFLNLFKTPEEIDRDKVFTWGNSSKPRSLQGCFSFGNKSFLRKPLRYVVKTYKLIN